MLAASKTRLASPARKASAMAAASLEALFERVAKEELRLSTLKTRNMDSLDFHDLHVASIRNAFASAYSAGLEAGKKAAAPAKPDLASIKTSLMIARAAIDELPSGKTRLDALVTLKGACDTVRAIEAM